MGRSGFLIVAIVMIAAGGISSAWADPDVAAGKKLFAKCSICHSVVEGQNKLGPSLWGVVGRHSAVVPGFTYSEAMKGADKVWDAATLDVYLTNPRGLVAGTKMIFPGLKEQADRENVIAYLETLK